LVHVEHVFKPVSNKYFSSSPAGAAEDLPSVLHRLSSARKDAEEELAAKVAAKNKQGAEKG
jgi:hypothetical protein